MPAVPSRYLIESRKPHMLWNATEAKALLLQAHCKEEVEDFMKIASALLVNVGTLSPDWTEGMRLAAEAANALGKPWVLDPVGAGATPFRRKARFSHHHVFLQALCQLYC